MTRNQPPCDPGTHAHCQLASPLSSPGSGPCSVQDIGVSCHPVPRPDRKRASSHWSSIASRWNSRAAAWRQRHAPQLQPGGRLISLFCYEPSALPQLLAQLAGTPDHLLVTPGRPLAAVQQAVAGMTLQPHWSALPYTDQNGFDELLWGCDLNFVRGEDSLVRALWAGQPFVWHIYPQDDNAHHVKLQAFLDWLQAPESLRQFHRVWNGIESGPLPAPGQDTLAEWAGCTRSARLRLLAQDDLCKQFQVFAQDLVDRS